VRLSDSDELLFRQVHPTFVRDGRVGSQAFRPTAKDEGCLSVARGALTTPRQAYHHHTGTVGLDSAGTWAVSVGECGTLSLVAFEDPIAASAEAPADPAHAFIDFRELSRSHAEARGMKLARLATSRGRLFPEPDTGGAAPSDT